MVIIEKRKILPAGQFSKAVTIPKGHTILRKGNVAVTMVANNVIVIAPEDMSDNEIKKDLEHIVKNM